MSNTFLDVRVRLTLLFVPASKVAHPSYRWKRWLYITHRWIGIVTCLFFVIWFASGLVMLYVPYPKLTSAERLEGLRSIDWRLVNKAPRGPAEQIVLEMQGSSPVWRIDPWDGPQQVFTAATGRGQSAATRQEAAATASSFGKAPVIQMESLERDQWTVANGFDKHRPLWKATLADNRGRELYISSRTGAVVQATDGQERFWNWLGSVPHWIYPTVLRQNSETWRQVVMWVSGPCILGALAGMWIGILRTRTGERRFGGGRMTPYRGWMHWHHIAGLIGGVFLTTWIFSGWLSVDPGRLFASPGISIEARAAYARARPLDLDVVGLARRAPHARRIELQWALGQPVLLIERNGQRTVMLRGDTLQTLTVDPDRIAMAAGRLVPGGKIIAADRLSVPDAYWYEVGEPAILPVVRLKFDDPANTWVFVDPATGKIVGTLDTRRRIYRWAFNLLHRWDMNVLIGAPPARELVVWVMSLIGLVTSITGIRIAWTRLRRPKRTALVSPGR